MAETTTVPVVQYSKANRESKKGEDFACAIVDGDSAPAAFAIFDGHSGKETARICSEVVCQRLLKQGPPFAASDVIDTLWTVDEEIGSQKVRDGATAQILLVEKVGDKLKGTVAWCGDSSLVLANTTDGTVIFSTASHTAGPDHQEGGAYESEKVLLERYGALRKAVEATAGIDTVKTETTAEMVREAIKSLGETPKEEEVALVVRALRRGKIVAEMYWEINPDKIDEEYVRKNVHVRQRDKEHDVNQVWVVSTQPKHGMPGYSDVQMTRSIGDWKAADMVLPHAQVETFEVPAGEAYRVCLASDGLWDVVDFARAATIMHRSSGVEQAANELLRIPEKVYIEERGHEMMDDDTTILVVELNPSGRKVEPPVFSGSIDPRSQPEEASGGGGCCALM